jgi:Domain of unknown function (DUF4268)
MYSRQEASQFRKNFWTSFGQYMRPLRNADDEPVNWLNYKTGVKHLYFRMDADNNRATIAIELRHPDPLVQLLYFEKFRSLEKLLHQTVGEIWQWQLRHTDEDGKQVSRIGTQLRNVNVFDINDWPAIISFLKPRILALDNFWMMVKDGFDH